MNIPFVDLRTQYESISTEIDSAIKNVIHDTAFIRGHYVEAFEKNFAEYCGARHCVGVGNGTDALYIAMRVLGIGSGDEVIVPANSFIASAEAVSLTGAKTVFADCHPDTYTIDPQNISSKVTPRTKAVMPVHLYGQPCDMEAVSAVARRHSIAIIQDCAQAHGAEINGNRLIEYGDVLCFSFYPGKNLGAFGDGGAIVTNDMHMAKKIYMFANHGRLSKFGHEFEGMNSRLDGIQAAILNVKLKHLDQWIQKRRAHAARYNKLLGGISDVVVPWTKPDCTHVYHLYVIRCRYRAALQDYLRTEGIATGIHYPVALPNTKAYAYLGHEPEDFPVASRYQDEILSLPLYPEITGDMIAAVAEAIQKFVNRRV